MTKSLGEGLRLIGEGVSELLWPTRCVICDIPGTLLCERCRLDLPFIDALQACPYCGQAHGRHECLDCNSFIVRERGLETGKKLTARGDRWKFGAPQDKKGSRDPSERNLDNRITASESAVAAVTEFATATELVTTMGEKQASGPAVGQTSSRGPTGLVLDQIVSVLPFKGEYRRLITTYKDRKEIRLALDLAKLLIPYIDPRWVIPGETALVVIPAREQALRERGFDHMREIGEHVSTLTGIPLVPMLESSDRMKKLAREGKGRHEREGNQRRNEDQRGLDAAHRRKNMRDSFIGVRPLRDFENVILVDDVLTTGATLLAAGSVIKELGVRNVFALTIARLP